MRLQFEDGAGSQPCRHRRFSAAPSDTRTHLTEIFYGAVKFYDNAREFGFIVRDDNAGAARSCGCTLRPSSLGSGHHHVDLAAAASRAHKSGQSGALVSAPQRSAVSTGSGSTWWRQSQHHTINRTREVALPGVVGGPGSDFTGAVSPPLLAAEHTPSTAVRVPGPAPALAVTRESFGFGQLRRMPVPTKTCLTRFVGVVLRATGRDFRWLRWSEVRGLEPPAPASRKPRSANFGTHC